MQPGGNHESRQDFSSRGTSTGKGVGEGTRERVAQSAQVGPTTWEVRARPHQVEFKVPQSGNVNRTSLRLVTRDM
jgi:hypothetical protein